MVTSMKNANLFNLPSTQTFKTINRLNTVDTGSKKILNLIQDLNLNKAHSYGGLLIRTLKTWRPSMIKRLSLLFGKSLQCGVFAYDWKKYSFSAKK